MTNGEVCAMLIRCLAVNCAQGRERRVKKMKLCIDSSPCKV